MIFSFIPLTKPVNNSSISLEMDCFVSGLYCAGDISAKEQELSEQSAAKSQLSETIDKLEKTLKDQREVGTSLESELETVNEKLAKLQQDHENQMSLYQQLEMEVARKSTELTEKEDVELQIRSEVTRQTKELETLGRKIAGLETVKKDLERDKEKLKMEAVEKNKEVEELQHQALVDRKNLNLLTNDKESVEMKLERSAQNVKNETFKLKNMEGVKSDLQSQILQLEEQQECQQRFISRYLSCHLAILARSSGNALI